MRKQNLKTGKQEFYCNKCKKKYREWSVPDSQWYILPSDLHKLELCKQCFKKYSKIKNPKYLTYEQLLSGKYAYIR